MEYQKQPPEVFCKNGVLRNFAKFTGKHLSSNIIEGIKAVLFFFHEKTSHAQKVQKVQKTQNVNKGLSLKCFIRA